MSPSRVELQRQLAKLERDVPEMQRIYPDAGDFISEFAGQADTITDAAGPADYDWALAEIDRILTTFGYPACADELPPDE